MASTLRSPSRNTRAAPRAPAEAWSDSREAAPLPHRVPAVDADAGGARVRAGAPPFPARTGLLPSTMPATRSWLMGAAPPLPDAELAEELAQLEATVAAARAVEAAARAEAVQEARLATAPQQQQHQQEALCTASAVDDSDSAEGVTAPPQPRSALPLATHTSASPAGTSPPMAPPRDERASLLQQHNAAGGAGSSDEDEVPAPRALPQHLTAAKPASRRPPAYTRRDGIQSPEAARSPSRATADDPGHGDGADGASGIVVGEDTDTPDGGGHAVWLWDASDAGQDTWNAAASHDAGRDTWNSPAAHNSVNSAERDASCASSEQEGAAGDHACSGGGSDSDAEQAADEAGGRNQQAWGPSEERADDEFNVVDFVSQVRELPWHDGDEAAGARHALGMSSEATRTKEHPNGRAGGAAGPFTQLHSTRRFAQKPRARWHGTMSHRIHLGVGDGRGNGDDAGGSDAPGETPTGPASPVEHATAAAEALTQVARPKFLGYKPNPARLLQKIRQGGKTTQSRDPTKSRVHAAEAAPARAQQAVHPLTRKPEASPLTLRHAGGAQRYGSPALHVAASLSSPVLMGSPAPNAVSGADLAHPTIYTTNILLGRMEQLALGNEREQAACMPLPPHQAHDAAVKAATAAANVPTDEQMYVGLPALEPPAPPPRVGKQLHPGWVASRAAKPEIGALWSEAEQTPGVCKTRPVAVYMRPKPADVSDALLALLPDPACTGATPKYWLVWNCRKCQARQVQKHRQDCLDVIEFTQEDIREGPPEHLHCVELLQGLHQTDQLCFHSWKIPRLGHSHYNAEMRRLPSHVLHPFKHAMPGYQRCAGMLSSCDMNTHA
eukprot:366112-Chlamydomonas_euryale.AAC.8